MKDIALVAANNNVGLLPRVLWPIITTWLVIFTQFNVSAQAYDTAHFYAGEVTAERQAELINQVLNSPIQPADTHPRLYGTNDIWYQTIEKYEALDPDCDWQGSSGWGTIKNIKYDWDRFSLGGDSCDSGSRAIPSSIEEHSLANEYLTGSVNNWTNNEALRIVHLIRRMNYCHEIEAECTYTQEEIARLSSAFIDYEIDRLRNSARNSAGYISHWHKGYSGNFFDLGSLPAFKLWTLILDTFWNSEYLSAEDFAFVAAEMENEIDSYIEIYNLPASSSGALGRWAIHNGNNWTPILNAAATFWAITFWHEEAYADKAREVLGIVLESNWLHRDEILSDGAYTEGPGYLNVSLSGSLTINNLLLASFGQPNHAVKWGLMGEQTTKWMTDNIATDGKFIDFGDAWARSGYSDLYLMDLLYWQELVGLAQYNSVEADACQLADYFATSYYLYAFYDTWSAAPHYARDFYSLTKQCLDEQASSETLVFSEYQLSTLRQILPGTTSAAQDVSDDNIRNLLADQTFLAGNAVSNTFSHRELDFGAVIWTSFGSRLLADWGYGQLSGPYEFLDVTGADGQLVPSDEHSLEFSIKHISGDINLSKFMLSLKLKGVSQFVILSDYISELSDEWTRVSIPLSDFAVTDWTGRGEGLEYIRIRVNGFVKSGEFGLDEIKVVDASGNDAIVWYGDTHTESLEQSEMGITPQISHPARLQISGVESSGGAQGSDSWVRISDSGSFAEMEVFYSNDTEDLVVANYMDKLPIGANTLVIPNAQDQAATKPEITNNSQFDGETGQIYAIDVDGRDAIHMNASLVYGTHLEEGHLRYFHRYLIPLDDGNFVILDSFKAKPGKEDYIQEFWYSYKNPDGECASGASDVEQQLDENGALLLIPRCNDLTRVEATESYGRITTASLEAGQFVLGAPDFLSENTLFNGFIEEDGLYLINRLNNKEMRRLARFEPEQAVSEDVRVFLLQSSTDSDFSSAQVENYACGDDVCFSIAIEGGDSLDLTLSKVEDQYVLAGTDVSLPDGTPDEVDLSNIVVPIGYSASHPARVGSPDALFDEQSELTEIPVEGSSTPDLRYSAPYVKFNSDSTLPMRQSVETDSQYDRFIYVDENGDPLSATFTFELENTTVLEQIMYFDISSSARPGNFVVWTSLDNSDWTLAYSGSTGQFRKWASIPLANIQAKYIKFEMPEENAAKGITEMLIFGEAQTVGEEALIMPAAVTSLHPDRLPNFAPLFDEQSELTTKPLAGDSTPDLRASRPVVKFSDVLDALPMRQAVETESVYGRHIYVDENGEPMTGTIIIELEQVHQLTEVMYFDMSSQWRPGHIVMSHSMDGENWTSFYDEETSLYRKWVSVPMAEADAKFIKLDFWEQNAATAMSEILIYGKAYQ